MSFLPLSQGFTEGLFQKLQRVRLVATDLDGTLTWDGKFHDRILQVFQNLKTAGCSVVIVTGRSAGWVASLAHYLPIWGAIAENGGVLYLPDSEIGHLTDTLLPLAEHRQQIEQCFQKLSQTCGPLTAAGDNPFRWTDWTFEVVNLTPDQLKVIANQLNAWGWGFTHSHIQGHIMPQAQTKAQGLRQWLDLAWPDWAPEQVLTVGDSPNDQSLFDPQQFPLSIGVANIKPYQTQLEHGPSFVTQAVAGEGFCELVDYLLAARNAA